ncbi:MAG: hypothetical protein JNM81_16280 [Rhodospirillaceae bacterium]|nr:hypothetical protein [Rhodospirillaceae bacterium]
MFAALVAKYLFIAGTIPFILLGTLHWLFTFLDMKKPTRFAPRDDVVRIGMQATTMRLTNRTSMWKAWMGFHHSHSIGAIFFGLIFLILAVQDFGALVNNTVLMRLATVVPLIYLWVAVRFWFRTPIIGIAISAACFIASFLLTL